MASKSYQYAEGFNITDTMKKDFVEDGYVLVRGLFPDTEVKHIEQALQTGSFAEHTFGLPDDGGKEAHMILWNHPGVDVTGMVARCDKVVNSCETFLGGDVYHYHTKLMKKPPKIGGKHVWHQDYGYWYDNGCLLPNMMTVFIAIDKCTKTNSCLQVLKGSHKCGRIEHISVAGQVGADMARVDEIAKICPLQFVEMGPGDALFFDCNLLHCSSANTSMDRRWAFLCAYNRVDNNPTKEHHHPRYTKLEKVLKGSHKCGRIEHISVAGQVGADMARVDEIAKICPLQFVEMGPGDALFFDCNLLHCSSANTSMDRRWAFLCAYNRVDNNPTKEHHHPRYTKLEKVPDSAILDCKEFTNMDGKWFLEIDKLTSQVHGRKVPVTEQ